MKLIVPTLDLAMTDLYEILPSKMKSCVDTLNHIESTEVRDFDSLDVHGYTRPVNSIFLRNLLSKGSCMIESERHTIAIFSPKEIQLRGLIGSLLLVALGNIEVEDTLPEIYSGSLWPNGCISWGSELMVGQSIRLWLHSPTRHEPTPFVELQSISSLHLHDTPGPVSDPA